MATTLFTEQENGNLKLVAEVEDIDNAALAVDALLDEQPRLRTTEFVAIVGSLEDGQITRVVVLDDQPVMPRRRISVSANGNGPEAEVEAPKRRGRPRKSEEAPKRRGRPPGSKNKSSEAPKRRGRPPGSKNKQAPKVDGRTKAGRAAKATGAAKAKRAKPGPKPKAKGGGSPFKRNAKSDE